MNKILLTTVLAVVLASGAWTQDSADEGPSALGSTRAELLAEIGKPLDEIKDKSTLKGLYDSILVTTDPTQERPTAVLYFLSKGISVDFVVMSFYTPEYVSGLQADKNEIDTTVTGNGFAAQNIPGLPEGQTLYYSADSKEFVFLADDNAKGNVKVIFVAYTADNKTLGPLGQIIPGVIAKVQKDLKL